MAMFSLSLLIGASSLVLIIRRTGLEGRSHRSRACHPDAPLGRVSGTRLAVGPVRQVGAPLGVGEVAAGDFAGLRAPVRRVDIPDDAGPGAEDRDDLLAVWE